MVFGEALHVRSNRTGKKPDSYSNVASSLPSNPEWIEMDGRRTSMEKDGPFAIQFSIPGRHDCGAGICVLGPIRPTQDRVTRIGLSADDEMRLHWASGAITSLGIVAPPVRRRALRTGTVFVCWRDAQHETIQESALPAAAE